MSFLKNFVYFILSFQEKMLTKNLKRTLWAKPSSKRKKYYGKGVLLSLDTLAESEKNKMEEELSLILKSYGYEPKEVLEYIKKHGTRICYIESAKPLNSIGENEGFIYPQKGAKALYLSLLLDKRFRFNTEEMFVITKGEINKYSFIYHFYNWYAFKHGIAGINGETQVLLNKYLYEDGEDEIKKLQLSDIYKLKDAIKQDKAAIEFVFKLCRNYEGTKQALEKLKNDGANI